MYPPDFYGEGPLRGDGGVCVPNEANPGEQDTQDILVVICHVGSLLVAGITHLKALLWKCGVVSEGTDGASKYVQMYVKNVTLLDTLFP